MMTTCPGQEQLSGFVLGLLSDAAFEEIAEHVIHCRPCEAVVETLETRPDTLLSVLRQPIATDPVLDESRCREGGRVDPAARDVCRRISVFGHNGRPAGDRSDIQLPPQGPDEIGRLAHYRVLKVLGEGGKGIVFLAE